MFKDPPFNGRQMGQHGSSVLLGGSLIIRQPANADLSYLVAMFLSHFGVQPRVLFATVSDQYKLSEGEPFQ